MSTDSLSILITNGSLAGNSGTVTVVRDLALGLLSRGHRPMIYTVHPGELGMELSQRGIPVARSVSALPTRPDIVHGHHHGITTAAILSLRDVPSIFVCHDPTAWFDHPPAIGLIRQYVAVDQIRRDRLLAESWIPASNVRVVFNGVDVQRFAARATSMPLTPRRAVLFSNHATPENFGGQLLKICHHLGLPLDVIGTGFRSASNSPEKLLPHYDVAFAVGLSALEAMACGAACVLCGPRGIGPLVTTDNISQLRSFNFGHSLLDAPITLDTVAARLAVYDPQSVVAVQQYVRAHASVDTTIAQYLEIYKTVLSQPRPSSNWEDDIRMYATTMCRELVGLRRRSDHPSRNVQRITQ